MNINGLRLNFVFCSNFVSAPVSLFGPAVKLSAVVGSSRSWNSTKSVGYSGVSGKTVLQRMSKACLHAIQILWETRAMNQSEYEEAFGLSGDSVKDKPTTRAEKALEHALDIRKFEIGLYWQRATYFWALIAAAFAGYFAILSADKLPNKEFLAFILSCIGFTFTWAWFQANRGSKYWQENWENHVDLLEDNITGPLYKTVLSRPDKDMASANSEIDKETTFEKYITSPRPISVSKINQLVSLYTLLLWIGLSIYSITQIHHAPGIIFGEVMFGLLTGLFIYALSREARRYGGDQHHVADKRNARVVSR